MVRALLFLVSCFSLACCEPKLIVGERNDADGGTAGSAGDASVAGSSGAVGAGGAAGYAGDMSAAGAAGAAGSGEVAGAAGAGCPDTGDIPGPMDPIAVPWSTGFENGFCDFEAAGGFCVTGGTIQAVSSPTPPFGQFAAEFSVNTSDTNHNQARCVRQGTLPAEAFYGAWYYIPAVSTLVDNDSLWNLFHFRGGDASKDGLWDVSIVNTASGDLELLVYDFLTPTVRKQTTPPVTVPIGRWFHIQFYLKRASDKTGAIKLYQDGKLLIEASDLVTDDSSWAQWYVGNIGEGLTPVDSTLYVDDVTIGTTLN